MFRLFDELLELWFDCYDQWRLKKWRIEYGDLTADGKWKVFVKYEKEDWIEEHKLGD